jgi:SNF2 family DNA or RNA helicase
VCQKDFLTARFTECLCGFVVQIGGIRFLYDNIIESTSRYRTSPGFGCILAHSMGLGKTMQVSFFLIIFFCKELYLETMQQIVCIVFLLLF